jgi:hypothetical protein
MCELFVVVILSLPLFRLPCARSGRGPGGFTRPPNLIRPRKKRPGHLHFGDHRSRTTAQVVSLLSIIVSELGSSHAELFARLLVVNHKKRRPSTSA